MPTPTATDICNRGLQRLGADRIAAGALFTEASKNANEAAACYDALRRSELRRNPWRFAIRRCPLVAIQPTTFLAVFTAWAGANTYAALAVVSYNGYAYQSKTDFNVNNEPDTSPAAWQLYYGPQTVDVWASDSAYDSGELVYYPATYPTQVYLSLVDGNTTSPSTTPSTWLSTVTYNKGDIVVFSAVNYVSRVDLNLNFEPDTSATEWEAVPADYPALAQAQSWLSLDTTLARIINPTRSYPFRSVYYLPANFLAECTQHPKDGSVSIFGAPTNPPYTDWVFEGNYILTRESRTIHFRFTADIVDTSLFDPMFAEGLGARVALELCEIITQSTGKLGQIGAEYKEFMGEARIKNAIEQGADEPPLDDYLQTRW